MRVIANVLLILSGLLTLGYTCNWIFPNADGLLDLSGLEWTFLLLFEMTIQRLYLRNRQLGYGIWRTCQKVVNSAGVCGLFYLAVCGAVLVVVGASEVALAANAPPDDLTTDALAQAIWLGSLVISAYFAAPTVRSPTPVAESAPTLLESEAMAQEDIEANK